MKAVHHTAANGHAEANLALVVRLRLVELGMNRNAIDRVHAAGAAVLGPASDVDSSPHKLPAPSQSRAPMPCRSPVAALR